METLKKLLLSSTAVTALTLGTGTLALQGCEDQTPAEEAMEERGDAIENRTDEVGGAVEDRGDAIEERTDN